MLPIPMSQFISANFYFSGFVFGASGLLLLALYYFRWKSDAISIFSWLTVYILGAAFSLYMSQDEFAASFGFSLNLLLVLIFYKLKPKISLFGVFFLTSMIAPSIYGVIWLIELTSYLSDSLQITGFTFLLFVIAAITGIALLFLNTAIGCSVALIRFSQLYFRFPREKAARKAAETNSVYPFVSIHVPCYAEPPDLVIETLNAISRLDYPLYEVVILDNNTQDPELWRPVEEYCKRLGERFRFFHIENLKGAKAGALNAALQRTSPKAELIAVLDADFVVQEDFLKKTVGFFAHPKTGFVQTCHDYRLWEKNRYLSACYYEYEVHFKLELPGLSEWDTGYTVGTMCLIRRKALEEAGGWAEWCLTEDSEIAVRIHALGYTGYNVLDTFGRGIIPETFDSYKKQRFRWTAGPVQQFQKHWRLYLGLNKSLLTFPQKMAELFHSLWLFFSESLYVLLNLPVLILCFWLILTKHQNLMVPYSLLFLIPVSIMRNIICNWIHVRLLGGNWRDYIYSALASRSLSFTRYIAFYQAWLPITLTWKRTNKFKVVSNLWRAFQSSYFESVLGTVYLGAAVFLASFAHYNPPDVFCLLLLGVLNQALTFFSAPIMAFLSERELNP